jgi:hypothetical protein
VVSVCVWAAYGGRHAATAMVLNCQLSAYSVEKLWRSCRSASRFKSGTARPVTESRRMADGRRSNRKAP